MSTAGCLSRRCAVISGVLICRLLYTYGCRTIPQDQRRVRTARYLFQSAQFRTWHPRRRAVSIIKLTLAQMTKTYLVLYRAREFITDFRKKKPKLEATLSQKNPTQALTPRCLHDSFHYYSPSYVWVCQLHRSLQVYQLRLRVRLWNLSWLPN